MPLGWGLTSTRLLLESALCGWNYGYAHTCIYAGETVMKLFFMFTPFTSIKPTLKAFFCQNKETRVTTPEEQFYSYFELK